MASSRRGLAPPMPPRGRHGQWREPDRRDRTVSPRDRLGCQPHRLWRRAAAQAVAPDPRRRRVSLAGDNRRADATTGSLAKACRWEFIKDFLQRNVARLLVPVPYRPLSEQFGPFMSRVLLAGLSPPSRSPPCRAPLPPTAWACSAAASPAPQPCYTCYQTQYMPPQYRSVRKP